jgi:hypothetical protein
VIFLAEASEEGNGPYGINFMVDKHWPEIDAEYCLAEGGSCGFVDACRASWLACGSQSREVAIKLLPAEVSSRADRLIVENCRARIVGVLRL